MIKPGIYRHYKNSKLYKVLGTALHSETHEVMVVYQGLYHCEKFGSHRVWVRPLKMFLEKVSPDIARFEFVEASPFARSC